jgi:endonuclease YncB( thermonuclease family)
MQSILPFFLFFFTSECTWDRYFYEAQVVSTYDADTTTLNVDLGFNVSIQERFRLHGINAWEVRGPEKDKGIPARDWFRSLIPENHKIYIHTIKDRKEKFGRYLCRIYIPTALGWLCINDELVRQGHAVYQEY